MIYVFKVFLEMDSAHSSVMRPFDLTFLPILAVSSKKWVKTCENCKATIGLDNNMNKFRRFNIVKLNVSVTLRSLA